MTDSNLHLKIDGLTLMASVGIYPEEHQQRQPITLDIGWCVARNDLLLGDDIRHTVDYDTIVQTIGKVVAERHFNLIETLIMSIETALLGSFPIQYLRLSVSKTAAIPAARGVCVSNYNLTHY